MVALKNVALRVPDLRDAEDHYLQIFAADLVGREVRLDDGRWYALRPEQGWDELDVAGFKASWVGRRLVFRDGYGFRWECSGPGFAHAGDLRGDWLDL